MTHQQHCLAFFESRSSLVLSTFDSKGILETSVAPFVSDDQGHLYLFISELAQHTQNILHWISAKQASIESDLCIPPGLVSCLLVADETQTEQLFARERLTMQLAFAEINRASADFELILTRFESQFGEIVPLLKSLPDFHLIQLIPVSGGYVKGFGQAFSFEGCACQSLQAIKQK